MKKALCCGINHFKLPGNDLRGCLADAAGMAHLTQGWGAAVYLFEDGQATKKAVLSKLTDLVAEAKAGKLSYLAFTYSAHGTHYPDPHEDDGLGEALCCYDTAPNASGDDWDMTTIITDKELRNLLNQVPKSCLVEVWLDTCYSGGMDRLASPSRQSRFIHNPGNQVGEMRLANTNLGVGLNSNIVMWCASSEGETSADAYIKNGFHGAFTWFWLKAYQDTPKASRLELLLATRKMLAANHYDQWPRLKAWNTWVQRLVKA